MNKKIIDVSQSEKGAGCNDNNEQKVKVKDLDYVELMGTYGNDWSSVYLDEDYVENIIETAYNPDDEVTYEQVREYLEEVANDDYMEHVLG